MRDAIQEELHGVQVEDPYRWLEDEKAAAVQEWMKSRNAYARAELGKFEHREALVTRFTELLYVDSRTAPIVRGERLFFTKKSKDREKSVHYFQDGENGEPQVLLDPNTMSEDGSISIGAMVPSHDGKYVAYNRKSNNADESDIVVMKIEGRVEQDVLKGLRYTAASWMPDGSGFYYTWIPKDPGIAPSERMGYGEIRFHKLGEDPAKDQTLRDKTGDARRWMASNVSKDGKYLFLSIYFGWAEVDVYVMFLEDEKPEWKPLSVGNKAMTEVVAHEGTFYVSTNKGAPKWKVYSVNPKQLEQTAWKEIIPESSDAVISDVRIRGGKLALKYLKNASTDLRIHELDGKFVRSIELPGIGTASVLYGNEKNDAAYFSFSSFVKADEIYKTSISTGETTLFAKSNVPVKSDDFEVKQVWYPSKDGTKVSMFVVHKKGLELNGKQPTMLWGYGGFNISITPSFKSLIVAWIERGGVYAVPNLRGGGEYGEAWHQAGMRDNKQNVFDDFIAAAEWLIENKYTDSDHLGISGRSNGGLLVGAAMTQRPDLYRSVICGVPLLDMVRYHKFGIGKAWIPEYGSADEAGDFPFIYAYSPYHHVKEGTDYPALLMLAADTDDRVDPMHSRKFVAAIEAASVKGRLNLLRIESKSGHGGADMRKAYVQQAADEVGFLMHTLMD